VFTFLPLKRSGFENICLCILILLVTSVSSSAERVRVGISTTLTGEVASLGIDARNGIEFANIKLAGSRFEFVVEDDRCAGKEAVTVAQKLIGVSKVKYVLGMACNQVLLSAGPLYQRAGVVVITTSATTGDVIGLGNKLFRLYPSDIHAARILYDYIAPRHNKIAILTEENEYPVLMERSFRKYNDESKEPRVIISSQIQIGDGDQRSALTRFKGAGVEALYANANSEPALIRTVQQLAQLNFSPAIYSVYVPGSQTLLDALGDAANGLIYADVQPLDSLLSESGRALLDEFTKEYGAPVTIPIQVPLAMESVRLLDLALKNKDLTGEPVEDFLRKTKPSGSLVGDYSFDSDGAVQGLEFRMFKIQNRKPVEIRQ